MDFTRASRTQNLIGASSLVFENDKWTFWGAGLGISICLTSLRLTLNKCTEVQLITFQVRHAVYICIKAKVSSYMCWWFFCAFSWVVGAGDPPQQCGSTSHGSLAGAPGCRMLSL